MPAVPAPPPNPYLNGPTAQPVPGATAATIVGPSGSFTIRPGADVHVGRDPAQCPVFISEPRVSGVHATLKFESAQLWVRDETSNNGTYVAGARIAAGQWVPVPPQSQLRFGPIEFVVQMEA
jgi:pSer/pThr/pTyr-binding forkhead associated (FHA) protein